VTSEEQTGPSRISTAFPRALGSRADHTHGTGPPAVQAKDGDQRMYDDQGYLVDVDSF